MTDVIYEKVKKILTEQCGIPESQITREARLTGELNLSYLEINDILALLTREVGFSLPENFDPHSLDTVADIVNLAEEHSDEF
jgi:acyl carrier protein